jgi:hypothetical protein
MHEGRSKFVQEILAEQTETPRNGDASDKEWQKVQAFTLRAELGDGRGVEGFPWAHYGGYRWTDEGEKEVLTLLFGGRALRIEGYNLRILLREIDDGRRRLIKAMSEPEAKLALYGGEREKALITGVKAYPDFEEIVREIKGEDDDKHRHVRRAAGR